MNFLKELDKEISNAQNTNAVTAKYEECISKITKNKKDILKLEEEFKRTLDSTIPEKINHLKHDTERLGTESKLLHEMLNTTVVISSKIDIVKALDEVYKDLSLEKLKDNIIKCQSEYLDGLESYNFKLQELLKVKKEINLRNRYLDESISSLISEWFSSKMNNLKLNIEPISSSSVIMSRTDYSRRELNAIREIDIKLNDLW